VQVSPLVQREATRRCTAILRLSWDHLGRSGAVLGGFLEAPGGSGRSSGGGPRRSWGAPGAILRLFEEILGASWADLQASCVNLQASSLGVILRCLGAVLRPLGVFLDPLGVILGRFWGFKTASQIGACRKDSYTDQHSFSEAFLIALETAKTEGRKKALVAGERRMRAGRPPLVTHVVS